MKKVFLLLIFFITCSAFAGENLFVLSSGSGLPDSNENIVTLSVQNADSIRGFDLKVTDLSPYITVDSAWTVSGLNSLIFSYNYINETLNLILLQNKQRLILPNKGELIYISYSVSSDAVEGEEIELNFDQLTVTNKENKKLDFATQDGSFSITSTSGIKTGDNKTVLNYQLAQNYPNPFNPQTRIQYTVPTAQHVILTIYNPLGQKVRDLVNQSIASGSHTVHWNGLNDNGLQVPAGVYIYRIKAGKFQDSKLLTLIR